MTERPSPMLGWRAARWQPLQGLVAATPRVMLLCGLGIAWTIGAGSAAASSRSPTVDANDNRAPASLPAENGRTLQITASPVLWFPQEELAPPVEVYAFSQADGRPTIPGPFLRLRVGEIIRLQFTNLVPPGRAIGLPPPNRRWTGMPTQTGDTLVVKGLERAFGIDALRVPYGESVEIEATAREAGDFFYWGSTADRTLGARTGPEAQLTGLIVIDEEDAVRDPSERFFLITMTDAFPETADEPRFEDMFEAAINGRSWPRTERMVYSPGERVRWRWVNGSGFEHPMHLHGFHFKTLETGDADGRHVPDAGSLRDVVTELMLPGSSFRMEFVAAREGNWLMHCHIRDHVAGEGDPHGHHDAVDHAMRAMDGLVLGLTVREAAQAERDGQPIERLRLIAREKPSDRDEPRQGYVLHGPGRAASSFGAPGPPIFLHRGQTTQVLVENRLGEPTNVHWHGLEIQSKYDGVSGWSRTRDEVAPLIRPGETFEVYLAPPRAGSYMYHTHMDATEQLLNGMYGPLIVLQPGQRFDPNLDRIFLFGYAIDGKRRGVSINGRHNPDPVRLRRGETYRFRFLNMSEGDMLHLSLARNGRPAQWTALAKDGADLPDPSRRKIEARFFFHAGETYDYQFTPDSPGEYVLSVQWDYPTSVGGETLHQRILVE
jgi:manganese oxidase